MAVKVIFLCDGCPAEANGATCLNSRFDIVGGKMHYVYDTPQDVTPEGWIAFDQYTGCCYCPDCWKEILDYENDRE